MMAETTFFRMFFSSMAQTLKFPNFDFIRVVNSRIFLMFLDRFILLRSNTYPISYFVIQTALELFEEVTI